MLEALSRGMGIWGMGKMKLQRTALPARMTKAEGGLHGPVSPIPYSPSPISSSGGSSHTGRRRAKFAR